MKINYIFCIKFIIIVCILLSYIHVYNYMHNIILLMLYVENKCVYFLMCIPFRIMILLRPYGLTTIVMVLSM